MSFSAYQEVLCQQAKLLRDILIPNCTIIANLTADVKLFLEKSLVTNKSTALTFS